MKQISITTNTETRKAYVKTPYNGEFVKKIKFIGGAKWRSQERAWEIPAEAVSEARDILKDVFGETDIDAVEKVTVRLRTLTMIQEPASKGVRICGKEVCRAYGRDSGAIIGNEVSFTGNMPYSGGSAGHPDVIIPENAIITLYNVPEQLTEAIDTTIYEIIEIKEENEDKKEKLLLEKEQLKNITLKSCLAVVKMVGMVSLMRNIYLIAQGKLYG